MTFKTETMQEILAWAREKLRHTDEISFHVLNPDYLEGYAGSRVKVEDREYLYRSLKSWADFAELLHLRLHLPQVVSSTLVKLSFSSLKKEGFHSLEKSTEKYGIDSPFAEIHKMEEPAFLYYYQEALENVQIQHRKDILNFGINRADEFEVIASMVGSDAFAQKSFVGIDHSQSAIEEARRRFSEKNCTFYVKDLNDLSSLSLKRCDLFISIGTLQSPSLSFKKLFMDIVQNYVDKEKGAIILGFPNSRWIGGEMVYGAKVPHYEMSELSLVCSDILFCKKYLQQKRYRVTITGKHYLFLTATKIGSLQS